MNKEQTDLEAAAAHESAHCCCWLALGHRMIPGSRVTVEPVPGESGGWDFHYIPEEVPDLITSLLAGYQAELVVDPAAPSENRSLDDQLIKDIYGRYLGGPNFETFLALKERAAADLVWALWSIIEQFSKVLAERGTLDGPDCERIFFGILRSKISPQPDAGRAAGANDIPAKTV